MKIPYVTLNDGNKMPQIGLGVWKARDGKEVQQAVKVALDDGYRLIDTAAAYGNEAGVGAGIRDSKVPREDIFVTTKLWNGDQGYDTTLRAFDTSLEKLGLEYIDLYLIHWPVAKMGKYIDTWKAFQHIQQSGRVKSIGVCNFSNTELDNLIDKTGVVPAVNQIELHPRLQQEPLRNYCISKGIHVESWSPIGGSGSDLLDDPVITKIAKRHGKSPAQVIIRWHIQSGLIVIPKSVHAERIRENIDVFDFELSADNMEEIEFLNTDTRGGPDPATFGMHTRTSLIQFAHRMGLAGR